MHSLMGPAERRLLQTLAGHFEEAARENHTDLEPHDSPIFSLISIYHRVALVHDVVIGLLTDSPPPDTPAYHAAFLFLVTVVLDWIEIEMDTQKELEGDEFEAPKEKPKISREELHARAEQLIASGTEARAREEHLRKQVRKGAKSEPVSDLQHLKPDHDSTRAERLIKLASKAPLPSLFPSKAEIDSGYYDWRILFFEAMKERMSKFGLLDTLRVSPKTEDMELWRLSSSMYLTLLNVTLVSFVFVFSVFEFTNNSFH